MTVQSLYHYFDSRDALLTALVVDGHRRADRAVQETVEASRGQPHAERLFAASNAYRRWALANRAAFLLLYGTPVPGYEPPSSEELIDALVGLATPFLEVVFDGWTRRAARRACPCSRGRSGSPRANPGACRCPPARWRCSTSCGRSIHGLVMLDLVGHLAPMERYGEDLFPRQMSRTAAELAALRGEG